MKRTWLATVVLLSLFASTAQAAPYYRYPSQTGTYGQPGGAPTEVAPDQIVRQGIDRLKGFMARGGAAKPAEIQAFLDAEISPYFDFDYMAKWAGGSTYRQMNAHQRSQFAAKLKRLFFSALARNLGTYSNSQPRIDISRPRPRRGSNEVDVMTRVTQRGGYPMNLTFRFYRGAQGWRVFDVTANGTSAVAYYRKYFRQVARRGAVEACCR